jgi:hypothetical protein
MDIDWTTCSRNGRRSRSKRRKPSVKSKRRQPPAKLPLALRS